MRRPTVRGLGGWSRNGVVWYGCLKPDIGRQAALFGVLEDCPYRVVRVMDCCSFSLTD